MREEERDNGGMEWRDMQLAWDGTGRWPEGSIC